jgi:AcrR family transcriptional regulator
MSNPSPLKQELLDLRRRRILEAAIETFAEYGFRGASMKQIAQLAGVSEGTLYNVFDDKLDLLIAILDPLSERTMAGAEVKQSVGGALGSRLKTFDETTLAMLRVLLSEALIDEEVREQFGARIIQPMKPPRSDGPGYAALAFVLGAVMLRLLGQDDPRGERAALSVFEPPQRVPKR